MYCAPLIKRFIFSHTHTHTHTHNLTHSQGDVERIFGAEVLSRIQRILAGSYDDLSLLPDKIILQICSYLDLQSIAQLSLVNRHLMAMCSSNQLWEALYYDHQVRTCVCVRVCVLLHDVQGHSGSAMYRFVGSAGKNSHTQPKFV